MKKILFILGLHLLLAGFVQTACMDPNAIPEYGVVMNELPQAIVNGDLEAVKRLLPPCNINMILGPE